MLITESELRSIVRQIIIEEARLDESKALDAIKGTTKKITASAMIKILTMLMLVSGSVSTGFAENFNGVVENTIAEMNLPAEQRNQLRVFSARLGDNLEVKIDVKNMTSEEAEEVKKAGNELAAYASSQEIPPKTFFSFLKNLVKKIKLLKPASKSGSSFPHEILDDDVEVKVKGDYYYLYHKKMDFYYNAPKKHFDRYMESGYRHGMSDELRTDDPNQYKTKEEQVKSYLEKMKTTDIEDSLVVTFRHVIEGTFYREPVYIYDSRVTLRPNYQNKLKDIYNSIK